jgi:hypothetical protein
MGRTSYHAHCLRSLLDSPERVHMRDDRKVERKPGYSSIRAEPGSSVPLSQAPSVFFNWLEHASGVWRGVNRTPHMPIQTKRPRPDCAGRGRLAVADAASVAGHPLQGCGALACQGQFCRCRWGLSVREPTPPKRGWLVRFGPPALPVESITRCESLPSHPIGWKTPLESGRPQPGWRTQRLRSHPHPHIRQASTPPKRMMEPDCPAALFL